MSSIHTRAAREQSRTVPTDLDITLWRLGNTHGVTADDVAAVIRTAELAGCWTAVERIRDHHERRARVHAAPPPAPRPGPKPAPTPPKPSILFVVDGGDEAMTPAQRRADFCERMARLADEAVASDWATTVERIGWAATARELRQPSA
jgi:hypothetical protein